MFQFFIDSQNWRCNINVNNALKVIEKINENSIESQLTDEYEKYSKILASRKVKNKEEILLSIKEVK